MDKKKEIPDIIVARLPLYLRALNILREKGNTTNSKELGEFLGFSAAQIRKDLSQFGEFGKQGTGYNIEFLSRQIETILNIDDDWKMILVGCGNIGHAIMNYSGFSRNRFHIVAAVDSNPELVGKTVNDVIGIRSIDDLQQIIQTEGIQIAMLTVPAAEAQKMAEKLVEYGIKGILSYAPVLLNLPDDIQIEYIDPVLSLQHITYYLK
ncbi:MAG: redox-sensing transcriptional repressor Rex [Flexilinea sp.]|nr:redox-sensing transcriptional repressor Rex [Flexilinea sp.]